ncbi:peptidase M16 [Aestuariicella hydrocarbonica]|uniref:Protease 3 n=1 Tax=Pseudomaricurvus hydrocarbonicus TaxID=1470433 RepID=A0A9E5MIW1_9GAMM|nr:insulinase family protein [Aestuariicella hydrocarbonica]NHO64119.1 peptidase M16 [Aestuariicella hydrocarbonica]
MQFLRVYGGVLLLLLVVVPGLSWGQEVAKSPNDERDYQYLSLSNQLRVLLISDPKSDKASAALDVDVGSADDPQDRQGLAHFLEHMLFLGTEKYPLPGEYQSFISTHGGTHNAYTSSEHTNYFFDVEHTYLDEALDRFAQFFVAPSFTEEYVDRERNAVHSEYKSKIKNPYRRELDVLGQIVSSRHPMSKFSVGSLDTLSNTEEDPVREDLLQFYQDFYSASNMTLVVLGRESLPQLREMVEQRFSQIPSHETKKTISGEKLFTGDILPARVSIKPVKEERRLAMLFPIPSAEKYYKEKPLQYLGSLLGHEGEGSLLSLLKQLGWAEGLSAGSGYGGRNENTFNISIQLTPEGLKNQEKVVATTFRMIQLIREKGVEEWRFEEQQRLAEIAFRFAEKGEAIDVTSRLASQMHLYPATDIIRGRYAFDEYSPRLIRRYLKLLRPDNFLWVVTAPSVETNQVSPFYSTPYAIEQLRYEVASVPKAELEKLHLPEKNRFIPRHLTVKALPSMEKVTNVPALIKKSEAIDVWFKQDNQYKVPRASINIRTYAPLVGQSAKNAALAHLYAALVNDSLNEYAYPAMLAGLNFNVRANSRGFDIRVGGYNDRQGALLNRILNAIDRGRFKSERFDSLKQELIRSWRNQKTLTPYEQLFQKLPALMFSPLWDELELADALESVNLADLRRFAANLWQGSHTQVLLFGNLYRQEALKLATLIEYKLYDQPAEETTPLMPSARVVKLPVGASHYHLPVNHRDVVAALYIQAQGDSVKDRANMMLMRQMLSSSFFHQLRTEKQLGYIVFVTSMGLKDVSGNVFLVQSPSTPLADVVGEIQQYVDAQVGKTPDFANYRKAILAQLNEAPKNMVEQADRYWSEIIANHTNFDRRSELIAAVKALTPETVSQYSRSVLGAPRELWLTAGAEPVEIESTREIPNLEALKLDSDTYTYP